MNLSKMNEMYKKTHKKSKTKMKTKWLKLMMSKKTWGGNSIMTNTNGRSLFKMMSYATYKTIEGFPPAGCFWLVR